jgi:hypothetical protein
MEKSTWRLSSILAELSQRARAFDLTDTEWAARAGIRKETLSRLRGRQSCDLATLQTLARAVGATLTITDDPVPGSTADGRFPSMIDRDYEEKLVDLSDSEDVDPERWRRTGPGFFMAGLAVMLASVPHFNRRALLELAERLHAGSSQAGVFALWLKDSPIRPSRFLPMLAANRHRAA